MSYEGYSQNLCSKGHYWEADESYNGKISTCKFRNTEPVWSNPVDDTNCESYGEIDMEALRTNLAVLQKCNLGHDHEMTSATYRIPTDEETTQLRCYRPGYGGTPLVPLGTPRGGKYA